MGYVSAGTFPSIKALLLSRPRTEVTTYFLLLLSSVRMRPGAFHWKCVLDVDNSPDPALHGWGIESGAGDPSGAHMVVRTRLDGSKMPSHHALGGNFHFELVF